MKKFNSKVIIFAFILIMTFAASVSIFSTILRYQNVPYPWDSGGHAFEGLRIAKDVLAVDIISFLADTYRQAFWPFFHSWLLAPAFLLFGNSYAVARSVSMFSFILFIFTIYLVAMEMSEKRGYWIGLVVVFLSLTSLPILVLSCMSMAETPGLFMTFLTILVYLKALNHPKPYLFFVTSILMTLTFFTKWHHGVFLIAAITLTQLSTTRRLLSRDNYLLFVPFLILMLLWFIHPQHISSFYHHSTFQPHFYELLSSENFLYYPASFLKVYHYSWLPAALIGMGFLAAFRKIRDPKIRVFLIHVLIGMTLMTIKLDNRHRYIISIVPSVWILGTTEILEFFNYILLRLKSKTARVIALTPCTALVLAIFFISAVNIYHKYPNSLSAYNFYSDEKANGAYAFIAGAAKTHMHLAAFGSWDYHNSPNSPTIGWHIEISRNTNSDQRKKAYLHLRDLLKNRDKKSYDDFIRFIEFKNVRVEEYHLLSFMKYMDISAYEAHRKQKSINPFTDKIIDLDHLDPDITCLIIIYHDDEKHLNYFTHKFFSGHNEWLSYRKQYLSDLGITISIYERQSL